MRLINDDTVDTPMFRLTDYDHVKKRYSWPSIFMRRRQCDADMVEPEILSHLKEMALPSGSYNIDHDKLTSPIITSTKAHHIF